MQAKHAEGALQITRGQYPATQLQLYPRYIEERRSAGKKLTAVGQWFQFRYEKSSAFLRSIFHTLFCFTDWDAAVYILHT